MMVNTRCRDLEDSFESSALNLCFIVWLKTKLAMLKNGYVLGYFLDSMASPRDLNDHIVQNHIENQTNYKNPLK